jgi:hypothetical protein
MLIWMMWFIKSFSQSRSPYIVGESVAKFETNSGDGGGIEHFPIEIVILGIPPFWDKVKYHMAGYVIISSVYPILVGCIWPCISPCLFVQSWLMICMSIHNPIVFPIVFPWYHQCTWYLLGKTDLPPVLKAFSNSIFTGAPNAALTSSAACRMQLLGYGKIICVIYLLYTV